MTIVNMYRVLSITPEADALSIEKAIAVQRQLGKVSEDVLEKAELWLLNDALRQRYDRHLQQTEPDFFRPVIHKPPQQTQEKQQQPCLNGTSNNKQAVATASQSRQPKPTKMLRWVLLLIIVVAMGGYGLKKLPSTQSLQQVFTDEPIKDMLNTPGWHQGSLQDKDVVYAVAQNSPQQLLLVSDKGALLALYLNEADRKSWCQQNATAACQISIQIDHDPARAYSVEMIDQNRLAVLDSALQVDLLLRLQDAQTVKIASIGTTPVKQLDFALADFPAEALMDE